MRQLNAENHALIEKYMWLVPVVYRKLPKSDELTPYKEEILSEGYYGLCLGSLTFCEELKSDPFSYLYKSIKNRMITFIQRFIYESEIPESLDEVIDETDDATLHDIVSRRCDDFSISSYIDDILDEYIARVRKDKSKSKQGRTQLTSKKYIDRLHTILVLMDKGFTFDEIGEVLGVSKQVVFVYVQRLREYLNNSSYRE